MESMQIAELIKAQFSDAVKAVTTSHDGQISLHINKDKLLDICKFLWANEQLEFNYIADIAGVDYMGNPNKRPKGCEGRFEVVYNLYSMTKKHRIRLRADLEEGDTIASLYSINKSADWHEREIFDLYGISFDNHPDMTRIMMPEDYDEGHPLRKDYPLLYKYQEPFFTHDKPKVLDGLKEIN